MPIIKTMFLMIVIQLTGVTVNADTTHFSAIKSELLGDGSHKNNAKKIQGESLKGYFYRVYGNKSVPAKDVQLKGPFSREKLKKFLKKCKAQYGDVQEYATTRMYDEKFVVSFDDGSFTKIFHVALRTEVDCMIDNVAIFSQQWSAIYLDNDNGAGDDGVNVYIDYKNCDGYNRAYLKADEYTFRYDQNPKCHADLLTISKRWH